MTDNLTTKVRITREEYSALLAIAVSANTLVEYSNKSDTFKFMVESSIENLEELLKNPELNYIT